MIVMPPNPLLHVCCAPCSGPVIEKMLIKGARPTILFYNPNIHPVEEYEYRKVSVINYAKKVGLNFIDLDYDTEVWFERVKGLENEPERGRRCSICFDIRLERTALYAQENGFQYFATSNGIANQKDMDQVNQSGLLAASRYPGVYFMPIDWREEGGIQRISVIAKKERFYKQEYCGCVFSLRSRNEQRRSKGLSDISPGTKYFMP